MLDFLRVQIDSVRQCLPLPQSKLIQLQAFVQAFLYWCRASKRQLQVLAGRLNWACRVVYGGRTFLRPILDAMNSLWSSSARFHFTPDFYADLFWWSRFLAVFNGERLFLDFVPECSVQTDAPFKAVGAFFQGDWRYFNFVAESDLLADLHINYKEVLAVVMAAENPTNQWSNRHVVIHSDNQAAVSLISKGSTKNIIVMHYLCRLFWLSVVFSFCITAKYIEGAKNVITDAISFHVYIAFLICFMHWAFLAITMSFGLYYKPVCSITCLSLASTLEQELTSEVFEFRSHTFTDTT